MWGPSMHQSRDKVNNLCPLSYCTYTLLRKQYRMYQYVTEELPSLVKANFPTVDTNKASVFGHSMGGHGALVVAFK